MGGLQFTGANTIIAGAFTADVAGAILSTDPATDIDTSAANGAVSLTGLLLGDSLQHLVLEVGAGTVALESSAGDIWVDLAGGAVLGNQITTLTAGGIGTNVSLTTPDGSLAISNADSFDVGDDFVSLQAIGAGSNIDFSGGGGPLVAQQVTLNAGGSILSSGLAAIDIDTSFGATPLQLTAGGDIGDPDQSASGFGRKWLRFGDSDQRRYLRSVARPASGRSRRRRRPEQPDFVRDDGHVHSACGVGRFAGQRPRPVAFEFDWRDRAPRR